MKKTIKSNSIRTKIVTALLTFIIPLIALLITYNFYSISVLREQAAQSNRNTLSVYKESLDNKLKKVDDFLLDIIAVNPNYNIVRNPNPNLKVHLATYEIVTLLNNGLNTNDEIDVFFLHSSTNYVSREVYRGISGNIFSYQEKEAIVLKIKELSSTGENYVSRKWFPIEILGQNYLFRVFGSKGTYVGAVVDISRLVFPLSKIALEEEYTMLYNTSEGEALIHKEFINENQIQLVGNNKSYYMSGFPKKYMVLTEKLDSGDFCMTALISNTSILNGLNIIQVILLIISLLTILLIPLSIYLLRKAVLTPLSLLVDAINLIKDGHWDTRMDVVFVSDEFRLVNDTFNTMINEIKALKIVAYEEKIDKQKAQLQHLLFQIKPHFFLNALKNLYGMAERKQFSAIQAIILGLSNHFRYMFKDNFTLVLLRDELNYVKNFLELQQFCMELQPECKIDVDERLINLKIPPISIQTFIENSLKHGCIPDRQLKINIKVVLLVTEEGSFADITVTDNGNGFSEETLETLNFSKIEDDAHIGLSNIKQRLKLIFGETAQVVLSNTLSGGATSEMIIPVNPNTNESEN